MASRPSVRRVFSGLTLSLRGGCFLASGLAAVAAAVLFGQSDILRIGILLLAAPLICVLLVGRARVNLTAARRVSPGRTPVGTSAQVSLRLTNPTRIPTGSLLLEDLLPFVVGPRPRFLVERIGSQEERDISYTVRSSARGRFLLGPLTMRMSDPLGMVELVREFPSTAELVVTPRVIELPLIPISGLAEGGMRLSIRPATGGEDDVGIREYRHGDSLHRVNWRATARYGEVMVRREEQPEQPRATLLLDDRSAAFGSSVRSQAFEEAVSAFASIAIHVIQRGFAVSVRTASGISGNEDGALDDQDLILDLLAEVQLAPIEEQAPALAGFAIPPGSGRGGLLVAVLGSLDDEVVAELTRWRSAGAGATAIVVRPSAAADSSRRGADALRAMGWRVLGIERADELPHVWGSTVPVSA